MSTQLRNQIEAAIGALNITLPEQLQVFQFAVAAQAHNATDFAAVARLGQAMLDAEQHRRTVSDKGANLSPTERLSLALAEIEALRAGQRLSSSPGNSTAATSVDVSALQARVTQLEAENATLRSGGTTSSASQSSTSEPIRVMLVPPPPEPNITQRAAAAKGVEFPKQGEHAPGVWENKVFMSSSPTGLTAKALAKKGGAS